jgi:hypothetical protein
MSPIPGPYLSYQIFDSYNPKFQYYKFEVPESRNIRDEEGKLLTSVTIFGTDEAEALDKLQDYVEYWKNTRGG